MSSDDILTRDDDLYDDVVEAIVLNDYDYESKISGVNRIRRHYNYNVSFEFLSISRDRSKTYLDARSIRRYEQMSKQRRKEEFIKSPGEREWDLHKSISAEFNIDIDVSLLGKKKIPLIVQHTVQTPDDFNQILNLFENIKLDKRVDISITDDTYKITTQNNTFTAADAYDEDAYTVEKYGGNNRFLQEYLESYSTWMPATLQNPERNGDKIKIPIKLNDSTISVEYDSPSTNDNFLQIVNTIGNGDPILIGGSQVYIAHTLATTNPDSLFTDGIWNIRTTDPQKTDRSEKTTLREKIPFL